MDDHELLRDYLDHRSERAFAGLVERHLPLVYATALRLVHDPAAAEDVAQTVFINLARQAWRVRPGALTGWLYNAAKFAAVDYLRREGRRRQRETEAMKLAEPDRNAVVSWEQLAPLVDDALAQLNSVEQSAILLRYFEGQSMGETGRRLSLSEPAAQKRVSRALEKMRAYFARRGVTASAALLASTLGTHAATPPPVGLAGKITGPSLAGAAGQTGGTAVFYLVLKILFMSTKTKTTLTAAALAALIVFTAAGIWWFTQPTTAPAKIAFASASSESPIDPKSPALHPPPSAPMVLQAAQPHSPQPPDSATLPPAPSADPHDDLKTALPDIARIVRTDGRQAMLFAYGQPDLVAKAKADPQEIQMLQMLIARGNSTPERQQYNEALAQAFDSLTNQTPTLNATGDEATYQYSTPPSGPPLNTPGSPQKLIMGKVNGKWYVKEDIQH